MVGKLNYMENDAELDGQWSNLMDKDGFQRQQMDFRNNRITTNRDTNEKVVKSNGKSVIL